MKYIPLTFALDAELKALANQNYSSNVIPFIQIIKDLKAKNSKKRVIDDITNVISVKPNNNFFVTIPLNYDLTGTLKPPVNRFFEDVFSNSSYHTGLINYFGSFSNVIPVLEAYYESYTPGDINKFQSKVTSTSGSYAFRIDVNQFGLVGPEILSLVTANDYIIYDLGDEYIYHKGKLRTEIHNLKLHQKSIGFKLCIVKQIYNNLTFKKMPNSKIQSHHDAYKCIDYEYFDDAKSAGFEHIGDWAGIRNNPMNSGGVAYPAYLTIEVENYEHHGFKGIAKDNGSFDTTLVPAYKASSHWKTILTPSYKSTCDSCKYLNDLINGKEKANDASKWKRATVGHFIRSMDYKITNGLF